MRGAPGPVRGSAAAVRRVRERARRVALRARPVRGGRGLRFRPGSGSGCFLGGSVVLGVQEGAPPFVVAGGAGPEGAGDPADLAALLDPALGVPQVTGHSQCPEGAADGHLSVRGDVLGQRFDVHGRTVGQMVDVPCDVALTLGQQREVISTRRALVRCGSLAVATAGFRVRARGCGCTQGRAKVLGSHRIGLRRSWGETPARCANTVSGSFRWGHRKQPQQRAASWSGLVVLAGRDGSGRAGRFPQPPSFTYRLTKRARIPEHGSRRPDPEAQASGPAPSPYPRRSEPAGPGARTSTLEARDALRAPGADRSPRCAQRRIQARNLSVSGPS